MRSISTEEQPWRSQGNVLLATCYLNQVLSRLKEACQVEEVKEGEERDMLPSPDLLVNGLRFDSAGVMIEGVIPVFSPSLAGQGNTVRI